MFPALLVAHASLPNDDFVISGKDVLRLEGQIPDIFLEIEQYPVSDLRRHDDDGIDCLLNSGIEGKVKLGSDNVLNLAVTSRFFLCEKMLESQPGVSII